MTWQGPATLAAEADVSVATASRVLNGERKVGEPHRSRVLRAAERLGYLPNALAPATGARSRQPHAIIIAGSRTTDQAYLTRLNKELDSFRGGGRVAVISQNRLGSYTVQPLNRAGARDLAEALFDLGHRRFIVLAGPKNLTTSADRLSTAWRDAVSPARPSRCCTGRSPGTVASSSAAASPSRTSNGRPGRRAGAGHRRALPVRGEVVLRESTRPR